MKPLSLEFTAFGSYPTTQSVDFSSLTELGLYVVTGPTGSGKTTIFDAMAYALYGEVPGARDKGDIRSQHANADATCEVTFRFSVDGTNYRVERTPEQLKPRKRGTGDPVKEAAKASLVRESDGVALASQSKKVTTACTELVGLDAEQFERVVLLPQGQFQEFLLATTAVRLPLLRQLFGTGKWLDVVEELKTEANAAKSVVADIERQLSERSFAIRSSLDQAEALLFSEEHRRESEAQQEDPDESSDANDLDELAARIAVLDERIEPLKVEERRLSAVATNSVTALNAAQASLRAWDARVELCDERRKIDDGRSDHEKRKAVLAACEAANPVLQASMNETRDRSDCAIALVERDNALSELSAGAIAAGLGDINDPDVAADELIKARAVNEQRRESLAKLAAAETQLKELVDSQKRLTDETVLKRNRVEELATALTPLQTTKSELETLAASEPARWAEVERARLLLEQRQQLVAIGAEIEAAKAAQQVAQERQHAAVKAFDDSAAPRLAESLVAGEPCPVCGSPDHPTPASASSTALVDSAERDEATKAALRATEELGILGDRQQTLLSALGELVTQSVEELSAEHNRLAVAHTASKDATTELETVSAQIDSVRSEQASLEERVAEINLELATLGPQRAQAEASCLQLRTEIGELADDESAARASLDSIAKALDDVEHCITKSRDVAQNATAAQARAATSARTLAEALSASPFTTVAEAEAASLDSQNAENLAHEIDNFEEQDAKNQTLLDENLKLELPDERPDVTELQRIANEAQIEAQTASEKFGTLSGHLENARTNLLNAEQIKGDSGDAFDRMTALQSLAKTCDGQGPRKIALETWVLAGELERVATAANHHLEKMTNGRYQIERSDEAGHAGRQSGLDLRVLDAHTGASRRPGSLSGGEQFQASLALALGLADVIGHGGTANGRMFEALFVDEGFGSLDPDSLDQAVDALVQIQATGRTVGVITHVEAMKDSLPIGIRVDRLPNGKGSTLTVRPND